MSEPSQPDLGEQTERRRVSAPELSWALRAANRASADVDQELARRLGMRPLDCVAMGHVMTSGEGLGPAELSARLGISTGSGTELVDRLERAGHIRREQHPHDRRRVAVQPTETAIAGVLKALGPLFTSINQLAEDFTPVEQETITRYLREATSRMLDFAHHPQAPDDPTRPC